MQCLLALCFDLSTVVSVIASENAVALQLMLLAFAVKPLFVTATLLLLYLCCATCHFEFTA